MFSRGRNMHKRKRSKGSFTEVFEQKQAFIEQGQKTVESKVVSKKSMKVKAEILEKTAALTLNHLQYLLFLLFLLFINLHWIA
jgi:hypothetical protein